MSDSHVGEVLCRKQLVVQQRDYCGNCFSKYSERNGAGELRLEARARN